MSSSVIDAVRRIASEPQIARSVETSRGAVDELLWRRDVRSAAAEYTAASRIRGAQESAAMDGADIAVADESPMGRVLAAAQAVTGDVPTQVETWSRAPLQVLAHLHAIAAHGAEPDEALGRPRSEGVAIDDPLNLGAAPSAREAAGRLALLSELVTSAREESALVVAGVVHGEILAIRPFAWGSGLIARASVRLVLADRGVDPSLFSIPEAGMMQMGRTKCVRAVRAYADGDMPTYFHWFLQSVELGARAA